jgi:hypothetical protein
LHFEVAARGKVAAELSVRGLGGGVGLSLLEALLEESWVVAEGGCHHSGMDIVEFMRPGPWFFHIVDFEAAVGWDAEWLVSLIYGRTIGLEAYKSGWVGLRSTPITCS